MDMQEARLLANVLTTDPPQWGKLDSSATLRAAFVLRPHPQFVHRYRLLLALLLRDTGQSNDLNPMVYQLEHLILCAREELAVSADRQTARVARQASSN